MSLSDEQTAAREFAWQHFALHATQRLEMFRSYVAFIAIIYAAFGVSLQTKTYFVGAIASLLGIIISTAFALFDKRIRTLLKISERYLLDEEARLSKVLGNIHIRLFRKSDTITRITRGHATLTYSTLFRAIYLINFILCLLGFIVSGALALG